MNFTHDLILRQIVNDGFAEGGVRALVIDQEAREFKLFAPLAFAAIGRLPLPLMSRSIVIDMLRAPREATLERFDLKNQTLREELDTVYRYTFAWAKQVSGQLDTNPSMPDEIYGRAADRWRVLIAIADLLGRGDQARKVAKIFAGEHADEDIKILLLSDIRRVFGAFAEDRIARDILLQHLLALDDGHWTEFRGVNGNQLPKALSRSEMVRMISEFGIKTKSLWPRHRSANAKSIRGYARVDFERRGTPSAMTAVPHRHTRVLSDTYDGPRSPQKVPQARHRALYILRRRKPSRRRLKPP